MPRIDHYRGCVLGARRKNLLGVEERKAAFGILIAEVEKSSRETSLAAIASKEQFSTGVTLQ
jgi:hypothetical protein